MTFLPDIVQPDETSGVALCEGPHQVGEAFPVGPVLGGLEQDGKTEGMNTDPGFALIVKRVDPSDFFDDVGNIAPGKIVAEYV